MKLAKDLTALFSAIAEKQSLYLPVKQNGHTAFGKWTDSAEVDLATLKTVKSAKDFFFMQTEDLMRFKMEGKSIEITDIRRESEPFVAFGVRACDARSFEVLDRVFLADPVDTYYQSRRENGTVVTLACSRPDENCFCETFGIDAADPAGDVSTWLTEDGLYWRANTEKGEKLTAALDGVLSEADDQAVRAQQQATKEIMEKLPLHGLDISAFGGDALDKMFNSPKWEELSTACLGCGTCTFVCPTCQCYDIRDFDTGHGVSRYRCWDSCMFSDFTKMAHGNPRTTQMQRFRQRFMHKLVYFPANNEGMFSCVGCGRCVAKCPESLNIVKVIKALGGNESDK